MRMDFLVRGKMLSVICGLGFLFLVSSCGTSLHKNKFAVSGIDLQVVSSSSKAASIAHEEFKRLDKIFNINDPQSELSRLNATFDAPVPVSTELFELLKLSSQVNVMTGGAFDGSFGNLFAYWKDATKKGVQALPAAAEIAMLKEKGGMKAIVLDEAQKTVSIKKEGLKIDLSAVAKGYMIDKVIMKLKSQGVTSALVSADGEIFALGMRGNKPWGIGLSEPKELEGVIEAETIVDEAIATAGSSKHQFRVGDKVYSGIIDPRTGLPVSSNIQSVTVITQNCTTAESLATAFFVMGLEQTKAFLTRVPSTMRVFIVTKDGAEKKVHILR